MIRKKLAAAAVMFALAAVCGIAFSAEAVKVSGAVAYSTGNSPDWKPLKTGDIIPDGATVRSDADGLVFIRGLNGGAAKLYPGTTIKLSGFSSGPAPKNVIELSSGRAFFSSAPAGAEPLFKVKTPAAAADVHGAKFLAETNDAKKAAFSILSGQITVEAEGTSITLDPDFRLDVDFGQPPGEILSLAADVKSSLQADAAEIEAALAAPPPVIAVPQKPAVVEEKKAEVKKEEKKPEPTKPEKKETPKAENKPVPAQTEAKKEPAGKMTGDVQDELDQDTLNQIVDDILDNGALGY